MEQFDLVSKAGKPYVVTMPEGAEGLKNAFVFAFHKSGSTLVNSMLQAYCSKINIPTFSLYDEAFAQGISTDQIQADAAECLNRNGYIFTGFRHFPNFPLDTRNQNIFLITRDPRDMLVSLYYSIKTSHTIPKGNERLKKHREIAQETDIDAFVLGRTWMYVNADKKYQVELSSDKVTIYKYEDFIYRKAEWFGEFAKKLGIECKSELIESVANQFDVFPEDENESQHIRQVHPGNFRDKLKASTIKRLNHDLKGFLKRYEYAN